MSAPVRLRACVSACLCVCVPVCLRACVCVLTHEDLVLGELQLPHGDPLPQVHGRLQRRLVHQVLQLRPGEAHRATGYDPRLHRWGEGEGERRGWGERGRRRRGWGERGRRRRWRERGRRRRRG